MKIHKSYGIIPILKNSQPLQTVIIKNKKSEYWGSPKGTPEINETPLETAIRELQEETGIAEIRVDEAKTFTEEYEIESDGQKAQKINTYWVGYYEFLPKDVEIDSLEARQVTFPEALVTLSFESARRIIGEVEEYLK